MVTSVAIVAHAAFWSVEHHTLCKTSHPFECNIVSWIFTIPILHSRSCHQLHCFLPTIWFKTWKGTDRFPDIQFISVRESGTDLWRTRERWLFLDFSNTWDAYLKFLEVWSLVLPFSFSLCSFPKFTIPGMSLISFLPGTIITALLSKTWSMLVRDDESYPT